ncbi:hypothetical protein FXN57_02575 [Aggregatibacter actinomycetemcomitans]|nr:hypothetical protein FXN57_02575 [Aggregatibacter actinomycetemcomitans]
MPAVTVFFIRCQHCFAGSGTTAYACAEHRIDAYCIEQDKSAFEIMKNNLRMLLIYNDLEINE